VTDRLRVLVTDGEQRSALAVVRSLGRAGHEVYVAAASRRSIAGASRFARGSFVAADAATRPGEFADHVRGAVRAARIRVVLPMTDPALLALLARRDQVGKALIPWPDVDRVRRIADKAAVIEAARDLGIAVPAQRRVESREEALSVAADLRWPIVLKPSRTIRERDDGAMTGLAVRHVADAASLPARLDELGASAFPLLMQERVVGPGVGVFLLVWDGRVVARFAHRRLREWPPAGGASVYAESIALDPALYERSVALLAHFGWSGVAMVEYKVDAGSGTPYLMEINGRFWGSLQLAIDAGVDFPALLVRVARGDAVAPVLDYRIGVRSRWWWRDVEHLLTRVRHSPARLALPPGAPSRANVVREFLAAGLPHRDSDVLRFGDPLPFVIETLSIIAGGARSGETPTA
jgi:predicted ATP-grasp superfamily ATP-dependent carboligase